MKRVFSGDVEIGWEKVINRSICKWFWRNTIPIEIDTGNMSWLDLHPDFVTRNTPVYLTMKICDYAENDQRYCSTDQEQPPSYKEVGQQAK